MNSMSTNASLPAAGQPSVEEAASQGATPPAPTIVSLIASATEIVAGLGLTHHLVGISHECDWPLEIRDRPILCRSKVDPLLPSHVIDRDVRALVRDGLSVYAVEVEALQRLRPDVILTQDHCEVCAVSLKDVEEALCALDLPETRVCSLHPRTLGMSGATSSGWRRRWGAPTKGGRWWRASMPDWRRWRPGPGICRPLGWCWWSGWRPP
jgi:hypothetical protein